MWALVVVQIWLLGVFAMLCMGVRGQLGLPEVVLAQPHHGYYGDGLTVVGVLLNWWPLVLVGFLLRLDDTYQHGRQVFSDPAYQSLVHRWYVRFLAPLQWVHRLEVWADGL